VDGSLARLVAPLRADPRRGAVVCDIDGTLAPIVAVPEDARVLPEALAALDRLTRRYALVACVTGRPAAEARGLVPLEAVAISGNHGLEVWRDGAVHLAPQAAKYQDAIHDALQIVRNDGLLPELGCQVEDKGITFTIHYRKSPRADHARRYLETQIAPQLERAGLAYNYGRMVLEVRPPVAVDKGAAVVRLRGRRRIDNLLYVGDDLPDLAPMLRAGISAAPSDAAGEVRTAATWKLDSRGGGGAFRETVERLLRDRGDWDSIIKEFESGKPEAQSV